MSDEGKGRCSMGHELSSESAQLCPDCRDELREQWIIEMTMGNLTISTTINPTLGQFDDPQEEEKDKDGPKPGCSTQVFSEPATEGYDEFGLCQCPKGHFFHYSYSTCNICNEAQSSQFEENSDPNVITLPVFEAGNLSDEDLAAAGLLRCKVGHLYHVMWGSCILCPFLETCEPIPTSEAEDKNEVESVPAETEAAKPPEVEATPVPILPPVFGPHKPRKGYGRRKQREEREAAELWQQQQQQLSKGNENGEPEQPLPTSEINPITRTDALEIANPNKLNNCNGSAAKVSDEKEMTETSMDDRNL